MPQAPPLLQRPTYRARLVTPILAVIALVLGVVSSAGAAVAVDDPVKEGPFYDVPWDVTVVDNGDGTATFQRTGPTPEEPVWIVMGPDWTIASPLYGFQSVREELTTEPLTLPLNLGTTHWIATMRIGSYSQTMYRGVLPVPFDESTTFQSGPFIGTLTEVAVTPGPNQTLTFALGGRNANQMYLVRGATLAEARERPDIAKDNFLTLSLNPKTVPLDESNRCWAIHAGIDFFWENAGGDGVFRLYEGCMIVPPLGVQPTGRLMGINRYDTSARISADLYPEPSADFGGTVFVANGLNFPDALAAGPAVASVRGSLLLVPPTGGLPAPVRTEILRLQPDEIVILGATDNVSAVSEEELKAIAPTRRLAGANRYQTSAMLAELVKQPTQRDEPEWGGNVFYEQPSTVIITNGLTFADALAGGAAGGYENAPLLLTHPNRLDPSVRDHIAPPGVEWRRIRQIRVLGSEATVSKAVFDELAALLPPHGTITRYAGRDRYETAQLLNADVFKHSGGEVTLTNGTRFPDALAGAARTLKTGGPIVPIPGTCIAARALPTLEALKPAVRTALGNVDAVSNEALAGQTC